MNAGQLLLVPSGIEHLRPGVHRVVLVSPKLETAALSWLGMLEREECVLRKSYKLIKPKVVSYASLRAHVQKELVKIIPEANAPAPTNDFAQHARTSDSYKRKKEILEPLVEADMLFRMLCGGEWQSRVGAAAAKHAVSFHSVLRLLDRYFRLRLDLDAACMRSPRTGKDKPRNVQKKLGRQHKAVKTGHDMTAEGRNVRASDRDMVSVFLASSPDLTVSKTARFNNFVKQFKPRTVVSAPDGAMHFLANPNEPFISQRQFDRLVDEVKGELEIKAIQAGEHRIALNHRIALGSARQLIPYPGHTYIIDATVADVYLVSAHDRRLLIGRPVLYIVIDAFSSLIVGVHVALEGPNFEQARIAIYRSIADKSEWLDWIGLPGLAPYLPQGCRPTNWLADRGELHSSASKDVQFKLQTNLSLAAPYRAEWKSIVERNFRTLNQLKIHWLPGAVRQRVQERGERDYRLDATLTLKEFTRIIVRLCAKLNHTRDMSRHLSANLLRAEITANPLGFWDYGLQNLHGSATFLDRRAAMAAALPMQTGRLNRSGLYAGPFRFTARWMEEHPVVQMTGYCGPINVQMVRNADVPNRAYCLLPDETIAREVELHSTFSYLPDFSPEDILEIQGQRELKGHDAAWQTEEVGLALERANDEDIEAAAQATSLASRDNPLSNAAKTSMVRTNRAAERAVPEPSAAPEPAAPPAKSPSPAAPATNDFMARMLGGIGEWGKK